MIPPSVIDEIKNRVDIVEVVNDFVELKKSGSSYKALSPFTSEKTPSFYVVPSKGIFKDFSSGKGGDAITFVMEVDGLSYVEALKYLAGKYGIEVQEEEQTDEQLAAQNRRESLYIVTNFAKEQFKTLLHEHEEGQSIGISYFKERGFTDDTIQTFELGYTVQEWDYLYKTATAKGYQKDILLEAGLIVSKEENKVYDRFRGRVMFPIHNITGKVIAFGARTLSTDKKQPKYLNSPETDLYNKSRVLYGLFQAKQFIRQEDNCFLVEGYTDVMAMHQAGVKNVVSSSGTALTEEQVKLIRRYSKNVTVLFDGDAAGIRAAIRGIDMLLEGDLNVRAVALPEGEDPDSYSRQLSTTAFQHFLESESQDIIRFKVGLLMEDIEKDPIKRSESIKDIVGSISKINDPVKRAVYLKECSDLMGISETVLISEQNKLLIERQKAPKSPPPRPGSAPSSPPYEGDGPPPITTEDLFMGDTVEPVIEEDYRNSAIYYQERESVRVLINYGNELITKNDADEILIDYFLSEIEEIEFTIPVYRRVLDLFRERAAEGEAINSEYLLSLDDEEIKKEVIDLSTPKYEVSVNWSEKYHIEVPSESENLKNLVFTNILRLKFRIIQHLVEEESGKLKDAADEEIDEILDEINDLKQMEVEIAALLGNVTVK
ncbi:MAG: DNA primase [Cytophagales bacterium]|nr:DNA primase [Cytophagales bacterium]